MFCIFYDSISPGKVVADPRAVGVKAYRLRLTLPNNTIQYKLNYSDDWADHSARKNNIVKPTLFIDFPALYKERDKITKMK